MNERTFLFPTLPYGQVATVVVSVPDAFTPTKKQVPPEDLRINPCEAAEKPTLPFAFRAVAPETPDPE